MQETMEVQDIDGLMQENVTLLRLQWSYVFLVLTHQYINSLVWLRMAEIIVRK